MKNLLSSQRLHLAAKLSHLRLPSGLPKGFGKHTIRFWGWAALAYALVLVVMCLLIKIAFSGRELGESALRGGQSVVIDLVSGKVQGKAETPSPVIQTHTEEHAMPVVPQEVKPGNEGMNPVPLVSLIEQTDKGVLPVAAADGTVAWKYYARPHTTKDVKRPQVAIVFTNLGLSKPLSEETLKMPPDMMLGFSPYASDINSWAVRGRGMGFESVATLPVQAENYPQSDPGPFGLLEDLSPDENLGRMHSIMSQFPAFLGFLASEDEKMTANKEGIKPYLLELKKRGLLFLYIKNAKNAGFEEFAKTNFFLTLGVDKVIDQEITRSAISAQLQSLVDLAKTQGYAVGLAHCYPPTLAELASWAESLAQQDVDLVPVSAVAKRVLP